MSHKEIFDQFLNKQSFSKDTIKTKRNRLIKFINYLEITEELQDTGWNFNKVKKIVFKNKILYSPLDETIICNYLSHINPTVTPRVYNDTLGLIKEFCGFLVDKKILNYNPAKKLEYKKVPKKNMDSYRLNLAEINALLSAAAKYNEHKNRNFSLVLALAASSTRIGELLSITEEDLRLSNQLVNCNGKSGHRIRLLVPSLLISYSNLINDPLRIKALKNCDKNYLFYSENGGPLNTKKANKLLKQFAEKAGVSTDISTYWLRRSFATLLENCDFNIPEIQGIFRHDDIDTTVNYLISKKEKNIRHMVNQSPITISLTQLIRSKFNLT